MDKLTFQDLLSLEDYDETRDSFRRRLMTHKKNRLASIGPDVVCCFEDRFTILYQVQEMLRVERIFNRQGIEEELETYNPLIPDGSNWKATMMIQVINVEERRKTLAKLVGIETCTWMRIEGHHPVYAIADEDLDRTTVEKTSAVHFLRFELNSKMRASANQGGALSLGIDHSDYRYTLEPLPIDLTDTLRSDLDKV